MLTFANIHISDRSMIFCSGRREHIMFDVMSSLDHWKRSGQASPAGKHPGGSGFWVLFTLLLVYRLREDENLNPEKESNYP